MRRRAVGSGCDGGGQRLDASGFLLYSLFLFCFHLIMGFLIKFLQFFCFSHPQSFKLFSTQKLEINGVRLLLLSFFWGSVTGVLKVLLMEEEVAVAMGEEEIEDEGNMANLLMGVKGCSGSFRKRKKIVGEFLGYSGFSI